MFFKKTNICIIAVISAALLSGCTLPGTVVNEATQEGTKIQRSSPNQNEKTEPKVIASIGNIGGVGSGPKSPSQFTLDKEYTVTSIYTYHYFNKGTPTGTVSLKHQDGTVYGPWKAEGKPGQGNVPNAYWFVYPNVKIKPGTYTVVDSNPSTWSCNEESENRGFFELKGY
jgi:hypothetical protein